MNTYTLYLDESETFTATNRLFSIGGVIIESSAEAAITNDLNSLKSALWPGDPKAAGIILHEKEISEAHHSGKSKNSHYNNLR